MKKLIILLFFTVLFSGCRYYIHPDWGEAAENPYSEAAEKATDITEKKMPEYVLILKEDYDNLLHLRTQLIDKINKVPDGEMGRFFEYFLPTNKEIWKTITKMEYRSLGYLDNAPWPDQDNYLCKQLLRSTIYTTDGTSGITYIDSQLIADRILKRFELRIRR